MKKLTATLTAVLAGGILLGAGYLAGARPWSDDGQASGRWQPQYALHQDALRMIQECGYASGVETDGRYGPHQPLTRLEFAQILHRVVTDEQGCLDNSGTPTTTATAGFAPYPT